MLYIYIGHFRVHTYTNSWLSFHCVWILEEIFAQVIEKTPGNNTDNCSWTTAALICESRTRSSTGYNKWRKDRWINKTSHITSQRHFQACRWKQFKKWRARTSFTANFTFLITYRQKIEVISMELDFAACANNTYNYNKHYTIYLTGWFE